MTNTPRLDAGSAPLEHDPAGTPRALAAIIERRILVNYRLDPAIAQSMLPRGLRPQIVAGSAVAGVCVIQLRAARPEWIRARIGHRSTSAAHRIAVEWDDRHGRRTGVFVPMRHSSSRLVRIAAGRGFPGTVAPAKIRLTSSADRISADATAPDLRIHIEAASGAGIRFFSRQFASLQDSSEFFRKDPVAWSPGRSGRLEGLRLDTLDWRVEPITVERVEETFFDDLPPGAAEFDHALAMHEVTTRWSRVRGANPTG